MWNSTTIWERAILKNTSELGSTIGSYLSTPFQAWLELILCTPTRMTQKTVSDPARGAHYETANLFHAI